MRKNNQMNDEIEIYITRILVMTKYVTISLTKTNSRQRTWPFLYFHSKKSCLRNQRKRALQIKELVLQR